MLNQQINDFINNNKNLYNQLKAKITEMGESSQNDFQNIVSLNAQISSAGDLSENDKMQLSKILDSINLRVKLYQSEMDRIVGEINSFESNTNNFLSSIINVRGETLLQKNKLTQETIDHKAILIESIEQLKELVMNLKELLKQLKDVSGFNHKKKEKLRKLVSETVKQEISQINFPQNNSGLNHEDIQDALENYINPYVGKFQKNEETCAEIAQRLDRITSDFNSKINNLFNVLQNFKRDYTFGNETSNRLTSRFNEEINELRDDMNKQFSHYRKAIENNTVKRYI
jgi:ElaB/YqjD/DUF883 family membrane-anchored ribosome-binding protein